MRCHGAGVSDEHKKDGLRRLFRTPGSLAAIAALVWRALDEFGSYIRIAIKVEGPESGWVTVLSTVDNEATRRKRLTWAFLLIGPETESPIQTANILSKESGSRSSISYTNDLFRLMEVIGNSGLKCDSRGGAGQWTPRRRKLAK